MKKIVGVCVVLIGVASILLFLKTPRQVLKTVETQPAKKLTKITNPLSISIMREHSYPGSEITIEQTLPDGNGYHQYLTSYISEGLKIYALLTVPTIEKPKGGFPVIVFNHGYINPTTYETFPSIGQYASYYPVFSAKGYIVFKPDYRGNGNSQGHPEGAYYSSAYATDDLNAISSIKKYKDANPNKIGVWGHSMGGNITLRDMVVDTADIKAAVIWGGVVGSYSDLLTWHDPKYRPGPTEIALRNRGRALLMQEFGTPKTNPVFWNSIDPTAFIAEITTPIQLHVGQSDEEVPPTFSQELYQSLLKNGKIAEFYTYPGADHNISQGFSLAMQRSLAFFDKYLK